MDQLLKTLGESLVNSNLGEGVGDTLGLEGGGDDPELPRDAVDEVMQVDDLFETYKF